MKSIAGRCSFRPPIGVLDVVCSIARDHYQNIASWQSEVTLRFSVDVLHKQKKIMEILVRVWWGSTILIRSDQMFSGLDHVAVCIPRSRDVVSRVAPTAGMQCRAS